MTSTSGLKRSVSAVSAVLMSVLALLGGSSPASAHDSTDGSTVVTVDDERVVVTAQIPFADLGYTDTSGDGFIDGAELAEQEASIAPTIVATARDNVTLSIDGEVAEIVGAGVPAPSEFESNDSGASPFATLVLATSAHDGDVTEVDLDLTFDVPSSDVVLTHGDGVVHGGLGDDDTVSFSLGAWSSALSFFSLGIDHIQFGPDHLLFLLVLTLAVAGTTVNVDITRRVVKLVTAFTLGHAISLGLAYFELVSIPAWVVEPAISLSIVAAAVLAIRGSATEARPWIAAVIGLIHGLGFASSLGSLGVATSQRFLALAAFNIGIDIAQTAFVLLVIGALWLFGVVLDQRVVWVRTASALAAAAFGVVWTVTRLADLPI